MKLEDATIIKNKASNFELQLAGGNTATFDTLNAAMEFAERFNITVVGPLSFGYRLGGLLVELSEAGYNRAQILTSLEESTDGAWTEAGQELAGLLTIWRAGLMINRTGR
jgi:hypothetical protein